MNPEPGHFKMSTMDDLPDNVLEKICEYIDWDCTLVVALPLSKIGYILKNEFISITFRRYHTIKILPYPDHGASRPYVLIDSGKNGQLLVGVFCPAIQGLSIQCRISVNDYNILAQRLTNLCNLQVSWQTLDTIGRSEGWISFPKLRQLNLGGPDGSEAEVCTIKSNTQGIVDNFGGLVLILDRAYFPNLEELNLSIIFQSRREKMFVNSLLAFLIKHQSTLKLLEIAIVNDEKADKDVEDWETVPDFKDRLTQLKLNLRYFFLHFYPYYEAKTFLELIDQISLTQTSIESHLLLYPRFQTFYTNLLEDNYKTLTCVALSIWIFDSLNCRVFEQCSNLKTLMLHARPKKLEAFETENYRGELATSELTNILDLPKTLKVIVLINVFIETKDTLHFEQFPNLEFLSLQGIGEKESLGVNLELFASLAQRGVLVEIYRGFNQRLMQVNENDDSNMSLMKLTLMNYWKLRGKSHAWYLSSSSGFPPGSSDADVSARRSLPVVMQEEFEVTSSYFPIYYFGDGYWMNHLVYQGQSQKDD